MALAGVCHVPDVSNCIFLEQTIAQGLKAGRQKARMHAEPCQWQRRGRWTCREAGAGLANDDGEQVAVARGAPQHIGACAVALLVQVAPGRGEASPQRCSLQPMLPILPLCDCR